MPTGINRNTEGVVLPKEVSTDIWAAAVDNSLFMTLATKRPLKGTGQTVQTITGEPTAQWVAEGAPKPVSTHTFGKRDMTPYKIAIIEPFSEEFLRDKKALYDACVTRLPAALGRCFDQTIMSTTAPGSGFDVLGGAQAVNIADTTSTVYKQLLAVDSLITSNNGVMSDIAVGPAGRSILLGALDTTGRPLFTAGVSQSSIGSILGAEVGTYKSLSGAADGVVGIAGDFSEAIYGTVDGIKMAVSTEATLKNGADEINLFQDNMVAVRVEIEVAFVVKDAGAFVRLTNTAA